MEKDSVNVTNTAVSVAESDVVVPHARDANTLLCAGFWWTFGARILAVGIFTPDIVSIAHRGRKVRSDGFRLSWIVCGVLTVICAQSPAWASLAPAEKPSVTINFDPGKGSPEDAIWLAYLMSRVAFYEKHFDLYEIAAGPVKPLFAEEVAARSDAAKIYRELQQADHDLCRAMCIY
jgi:hypothetical protein